MLSRKVDGTGFESSGPLSAHPYSKGSLHVDRMEVCILQEGAGPVPLRKAAGSRLGEELGGTWFSQRQSWALPSPRSRKPGQEGRLGGHLKGLAPLLPLQSHFTDEKLNLERGSVFPRVSQPLSIGTWNRTLVS